MNVSVEEIIKDVPKVVGVKLNVSTLLELLQSSNISFDFGEEEEFPLDSCNTITILNNGVALELNDIEIQLEDNDEKEEIDEC